MKIHFMPFLSATVLSSVFASAAISAPPVVAPSSVSPTVSPSSVSSSSNTIKFTCIQEGNGYATQVGKGTKQATLITWHSLSFGSEYTPEARCQAVTKRFQTIVDRNGGQLKNLLLTIGTMKKQTVVCAINQGIYGCNNDNLLFTLNSENAKKPGEVLARLLNIGNFGSGSVVSETAALPEYDLEAVVEQKLSSAETSLPTSPDSVPVNPPSNDTGF